MKILFKYLRPYRGLMMFTLFLAAINIGFSLIDPIILGKLVNLATEKQKQGTSMTQEQFLWSFAKPYYGVLALLLASITVAMISRIAKAFQDYFLNTITQRFGANVFTDGLQHAMKLPYQLFEDQRSGETLSILTKVRTDTGKNLISAFINILFPCHRRNYYCSCLFHKNLLGITVHLFRRHHHSHYYYKFAQQKSQDDPKIYCRPKLQHWQALQRNRSATLNW